MCSRPVQHTLTCCLFSYGKERDRITVKETSETLFRKYALRQMIGLLLDSIY